MSLHDVQVKLVAITKLRNSTKRLEELERWWSAHIKQGTYEIAIEKDIPEKDRVSYRQHRLEEAHAKLGLSLLERGTSEIEEVEEIGWEGEQLNWAQSHTRERIRVWVVQP